ncbi:MAG: lipid-A-disaccharide synthase [Rhodospirillales bacterium]|nr:lipid-A-disaccharide synthase [Rhodospirillales bacterium]MCB9980684.1 lipid-A-disaccharide synthase [Rhodospirillales bacterium]
MKIFLIAGEESGDILGADLMEALKRADQATDFTFRGVGGSRMEAQGLVSLFPMRELSLMGIAEILPKVPHLLGRIRQTADAIEVFQPDILLTIDSPDFCFRVAKEVQKRCMNVPFKVHYVAPTVWAWRPGRAKKVAALYDAILCLFPFEPPYFEREGMKALFTGHPMSHLLKNIKTAPFLKKYDLPANALKVGVLFGSRDSEVARMGPVFVEAISRVFSACEPASVSAKKNTSKLLICPTLPHLKDKVEDLIRGIEGEKIIITDPAEKYQAMVACDLAVATSGTVGLELSVLGVPHVIGYKMNPLTYQIGKRLVTTRYAHLGNIILQKPVVPEFIQEECTAERISAALLDLRDDSRKQEAQIDAFRQVQTQIKGPDTLSPSRRIAGFLLEALGRG